MTANLLSKRYVPHIQAGVNHIHVAAALLPCDRSMLRSLLQATVGATVCSAETFVADRPHVL